MRVPGAAPASHRVVARAFREEYVRLVAALERWPESGVPPNPGGWLTTTAGNRAIDGLPLTSHHAWQATRAELLRRLGRGPRRMTQGDDHPGGNDNFRRLGSG